MVKLEDWKGNRIKPGDTIVIVNTKPIFGASLLHLPNGDKVQITEDPPKHIWDIQEEYKVIGSEEYPCIELKTNGYTIVSSLYGAVWLVNDSSIIICIKDVSDNEQDYYMEYFKVK